MQQLCDELDLVVDLQQLAIFDKPAYRAFIHGRQTALALWLYEMAVAAAAQGWREFAPTLMSALPEIDCGPMIPLLDEILRGHDAERRGAEIQQRASGPGPSGWRQQTGQEIARAGGA